MRREQQLTASISPGENLVELLMAQAKSPSKVGATYPDRGAWKEMTWGAILEEVRRVSEGLVALGVQPGDRVAIFANTSLRWVICDLAASAARAITVPIYASNTPDEARYILNHSEATVLFVDNDAPEGKQAGRATRIRQRLADLKALRHTILFEGAPTADREVSWADFTARADQALAANPSGFAARVAQVKRTDPCCFIYTSGTTGDPKGVILTHGNWVFEAEATASVAVAKPSDAMMLFLPLAHSFAQTLKALWLGLGCRMVFAESTDRLMANLVDTRPTILPAVPRVFEKVYASVVAGGSAAPGLKGILFRWAMGEFDRSVDARSHGRTAGGLQLALAKRLVFSKVRKTLDEKLGGRLRLFVSGGAPLSFKIACFFDLLGYVVLEGYGLTETAAASTVNVPGRLKLGTVGPALPGVELKIAPDGEILIRGGNIMQGYFRNEAATAEALEPDGWFHTGDIGEVDREGFLRITDRKKDIIVTAGGKNVAPQNLENQLKTFPIISQAMVYGDKRKYLSALITVAEEGARKVLANAGKSAPGSYAELAQHPDIRAEVQKAIDALNANEPPYSSIKKFAVMDHDFTQESGELTPTLKVKRKVCSQRYKSILDGMYDEPVLD